MSIPTVRVANPADPGSFMTINATEFGEAHTLWPEQAEGFDAATIARSIAPLGLDPAVRDLAARIMTGLTAARLDLSGEDWAALSGERQLAALYDAEADCGDLLAIRYVRRAAPEAETVDDPSAPLGIAKGPRGLWFVTRGDARVSRGFAAAEEAEAERGRMVAGV